MAINNLCLNKNLLFFIKEYGIEKSSSWMSCALGEMGFTYSGSMMNGLSADFPILFDRFIDLFDGSIKGVSIEPKKLLKEISQYKILLVWVDNYFIDGSTYYCKEHYYTVMALLGIDKSHATIYDNGHKIIPTKTFLKAMKSNKNINCYYCHSLKLKYDDDKIFSIGIQHIADNLSLNKPEGIQRILKYINDIMSNYDPDYLYEQYFQIKRPGGTSLSRKDMSNFLFEQSETILSSLYHELSEKWRTTGNLIFKLSTKPEDDELRNRIKERLDDIYCCESESIEKLINYKIIGGKENEARIRVV